MNAEWIDLGTMDYRTCWSLQETLAEKVASGRSPDTLLLVEHPRVITIGASFHEENLLVAPGELEKLGMEVVRTDRGGDVTYHGPGQLVIYPIFDISRFGKDLHLWLRNLEEAIIRSLARFEVCGRRFSPHTGVWIEDRKIAAIGVKIRRRVNLHGIALNCNNSLEPFNLIVPCGISEFGVTSISREVGREITVAEARACVVEAIGTVFGIDWIRPSKEKRG